MLRNGRAGGRAGDPRRSPRRQGRPRSSPGSPTGDLVEEFQAELDAISAADPLLGGGRRHRRLTRRRVVIVIDEYLAVRVVGGDWPAALPDDELALTASRHWRLLQALHHPRRGQLSRILAAAPGADRGGVRFPHPEVLRSSTPRPLLDEAAQPRRPLRRDGAARRRDASRRGSPTARSTSAPSANVGRLLARAAGEARHRRARRRLSPPAPLLARAAVGD